MLIDGTIRILLVEDEEFDVRRVRSTLKPFEEQIQIGDVVANGDTALELLSRQGDRFDVVIMDMQIAGGVMGESLIRAVRRVAPSVQIIVITKMTVNITDFDFASRLMRAGAYWYCTKYPNDIEEYIYQPTDFILSIFNAYQRKVLEGKHSRSENKLLRHVEDKLSQTKILGISEHIQKIRAQIKQLSTVDATVLISGASGTGKELVAANIHYESKRKLESFIPINCGSIPHELVESELFGYEKGAFTGASVSKSGLFEVANHGTLFLDEISELPQSAQVKLLRVIQDGEIEKIGRMDKTKVDVRIIAATNKVLHQEMSAGRFREDLFYRLNVVPIYIPPLSDRPEDVLVLWEHFMRQTSRDMGKTIPVTEDSALDLLRSHPWPGNVRELKNIVQRLLLRDISVVTSSVLQEVLRLSPEPGPRSDDKGTAIVKFDEIRTLHDMEPYMRKKYFQYVRKLCSSDAEAAKKLGLAPPNYHRMCKELGLKS